MIRIIVCSSALIAFIVAVRAGLTAAFTHLGFWPGAAIGLSFIAICGIIAFSVDYFEGKRSQELLPPEPHDPRRPGL